MIAGVFLAATSPAYAQKGPDARFASGTGDAVRQSIAATPSVLETRVTVALANVTLETALETIAKEAGVAVVYSAQVVPLTRRVSLRGEAISVADALRTVLRGTGATFQVSPTRQIVLVAAPSAQVEQGVVTGKVINAKTKQPVAGATILVDDATKGVQTNEDGVFRLTTDVGEHRITVRAVGFVKQARRVVVREADVSVEFSVEPSASVLDEVIVTGTVVATERKAIPTPITVITAADIEKRGITRVEQLFRGEVPGVIALDQGSAIFTPRELGAMSTSKVYVRGSSDLGGAANPLKTYVDGVELMDPAYLGTIDPKSIEKIEIITGPQAATIYGSGAMGGVMQIFTKKGSGRTTPDLTLSLKYGMLQNNINTGRSPTHNHGLNMSGGTGPSFSYAGSVSYQYSGQWMPHLFNRMYGASIGATHAQGPLTATGSVSLTTGRNGTYSQYYSPLSQLLFANGDWRPPCCVSSGSQSTSSSQTLSLGVDYRPLSWWQHHLTLGKNQNEFQLVPIAPEFLRPYDSLFTYRNSNGSRISGTYNMTFQPGRLGPVTQTLTLGGDRSTGTGMTFKGCTLTKSSTAYVGCGANASSPIQASTTLDERNWGGFGTWQIGVFDRMYLTLGLRAERNPAYGENHKVDWTPTNGLTYTMERGDLTVKLLGAYGRATKPPLPEWRLSEQSSYNGYTPSRFISQLAAPDLRPQYERGPEGGIEVYYGNLGSFTVNHYRQDVTDLIESNGNVNQIELVNDATGDTIVTYQSQYQNIGDIRKQGWEGTASLNLGVLSLKGTYSWADSRITRSQSYAAGSRFVAVPSHTGNIVATYARGGTSASLVTNFIGGSMSSTFQNFWIGYMVPDYSRLAMYVTRRLYLNDWGSYGWKPGYTKSDLSVSQRINPWASATLNITNLGNSYGTEAQDALTPTLGRITQIGFSVRFPKR